MSEIVVSCSCCGRQMVFPSECVLLECPACGTRNARPRSTGAELNILKRAVDQRLACDFHNAEKSYQHVLLEYPDEHEALWGLLLCHYGVEYVEDAKTGKSLPTCHFAQRKPMQEDPDFQQDRTDPACYTPVAGDVYMPENPMGQDPDGGYDWTDGAAQGATFVRIKYISNNNIGTDNDDPTQNEKTADVYLPKIIRNTQYKLLCNIKNNHIANVIVVVEDWNEGSSTTIDFTDQPTFDDSFGLQWNGQKIEGNEYKLESAAGSSVECRFRISAPVGGKWYATLTGGDVQNYELIGGTGTDGRASGNIGGEASFTIKALNSNFEGTTSRDVKLVITAVSRDGRSMVVKFNDQGYYTITQKQS